MQVITAIDIGTDKFVTLIATISPETRQLSIVGAAAVPAKGIRKSTIVDLEAVLSSLSQSLDAAERMAGFNVKSAFVSVSGAHISSQNSRGVVAVAAPNQEIAPEDVNRVIEAAQAVSLPNDRSIIHVIPRDFRVDSQEGIKDPIGMTGIRLESEAHIITGMSTALKNLEKVIHDVGLSVDGFVFSGLASSEVCTTETERELGVVVVDIGAGSTSVTAFVDGSIQFSTSLPVGARHITQDIALGCRISLESAEAIKIALSDQRETDPLPMPGETKTDLNNRRKKADKIDPRELGITEEIGLLSKKTLVEGIMYPRMKEIVGIIAAELNRHNLFPLVPAGIVLAGGGAQTVGFTDVIKRTLRLPARVAIPPHIQGLTPDMVKPNYTTVVGLLVYGKKQGGGAPVKQSVQFSEILAALPFKAVFQKVTSIVKSVLP
jgi:cell division protein FtsA